MMKSLPKFGNDDDDVDILGAGMVKYAWQSLYSHETPRGGRFLPSCIIFATYFDYGQSVSATPDGKGNREALTDSVGPTQGMDVKGPTAMLNSVVKLPLTLAAGTPVLNIRFSKNSLKGKHLDNTLKMIRSFFANGGMQIQLSVLDSKEMRKAQVEPEKHRDLIVRIGGYSERFVNLRREIQDTVIARSEH